VLLQFSGSSLSISVICDPEQLGVLANIKSKKLDELDVIITAFSEESVMICIASEIQFSVSNLKKIIKNT
jgi:hypothetical protein